MSTSSRTPTSPVFRAKLTREVSGPQRYVYIDGPEPFLSAQSPPVPGRTYTQYMPEPPAKGLLLTGWYIASTNYAWQVGTATFSGYGQSPARYCAPFVQIQCSS